MQTTPTGFITLTSAGGAQPSELDIRVENIVCYYANVQTPNGGSVIILDSGSLIVVTESVEVIRRTMITVQTP